MIDKKEKIEDMEREFIITENQRKKIEKDIKKRKEEDRQVWVSGIRFGYETAFSTIYKAIKKERKDKDFIEELVDTPLVVPCSRIESIWATMNDEYKDTEYYRDIRNRFWELLGSEKDSFEGEESAINPKTESRPSEKSKERDD